MIDRIIHDDELLAIKCNASDFDAGVNFFTDEHLGLQVGVLRHEGGTKIQAHEHKKLPRQIETTNEVLVILDGKILANFYFQEKLVAHRICSGGDILLLVSGGHGFEVLERACIVEAKTGPYLKTDDKVRLKTIGA